MLDEVFDAGIGLELGLALDGFDAALLAANAAFGEFSGAVAVSGFGEVHLFAVFVHGFAVFPSEDAEELKEEAGFEGRGGGELEGAAFEGFEAGLIQVEGGDAFDGLAVVDGGEVLHALLGILGEGEGIGEGEFLVVAEEFVDGDVNAGPDLDLFLDFVIGFGAEEVVDFVDLGFGEVLEFRREGEISGPRGRLGVR